MLDLREADLEGADLRQAILEGADLHRANLYGAILEKADLHGAILERADLHGADLRQAYLREARLDEADLEGADLPEAYLGGAILGRAKLCWADLTGADLEGADLSEADLTGARLTGANLTETSLARANLSLVQGAYHARGLETAQLREGDAQYFENYHRPWPERLVDWERLRVVGRLPLFGVSYTALILIPIVFYGLALYNEQIDVVHAWAEQVALLPDHPLYRLASLALERLHPRPIPSQSFLLLLSTVLLATGSTLYTFGCPSRIKEFSRDQWCDQLGRSLLHYWPLAWKRRAIRLTCVACYGLGGLMALWVLGTKVWQTALFILKHSAWPWPWR
jgi:pentapeptide repeat protein